MLPPLTPCDPAAATHVRQERTTIHQAGLTALGFRTCSSGKFNLAHLNEKSKPPRRNCWPSWVVEGRWPPGRPPPRETPRGTPRQNVAQGADNRSTAVSARAPASTPRPAELELKKLLWQGHREVEQMVKRFVPAYPFAGRPMRFQSELAVLQVYADGRFTFMINATDPHVIFSESHVHEAHNLVRRVITYEGACCPSSAAGPSSQVSAALEGGGVGFGAQRGNTAVAEGLALVCAEAEDVRGAPSLQKVTQREFHFVFAITPSFQPQRAVVQPILDGSSLPVPGNTAPFAQRWYLNYVDARPQDEDCKLRALEAGERRRQRALFHQPAVLGEETVASTQTQTLRLPRIGS